MNSEYLTKEMHIIWNAWFYLDCFFHWICAASVQLFSAVETPSCCLASRERIYKTSDVAGPASAISSLSHKLKGGYACQHSKVIQTLRLKCFFSSFHSFSFHSFNEILFRKWTFRFGICWELVWYNYSVLPSWVAATSWYVI